MFKEKFVFASVFFVHVRPFHFDFSAFFDFVDRIFF